MTDQEESLGQSLVRNVDKQKFDELGDSCSFFWRSLVRKDELEKRRIGSTAGKMLLVDEPQTKDNPHVRIDDETGRDEPLDFSAAGWGAI